MTDNTEALPQVADAELKALYVAHFGSDAGWLGAQGSAFIEGARAALAQRQQVPADDALDAALGAHRAAAVAAWEHSQGRGSREEREQRDAEAQEAERLLRAALAQRQQAAPSAQAEQQCTRSHPHEDMNDSCLALTVKARADAAARQPEPQQTVNFASLILLLDALPTFAWFRLLELGATPPFEVTQSKDTARQWIEAGCEVGALVRHREVLKAVAAVCVPAPCPPSSNPKN